jgi:hypothetical protein
MVIKQYNKEEVYMLIYKYNNKKILLYIPMIIITELVGLIEIYKFNKSKTFIKL